MPEKDPLGILGTEEKTSSSDPLGILGDESKKKTNLEPSSNGSEPISFPKTIPSSSELTVPSSSSTSGLEENPILVKTPIQKTEINIKQPEPFGKGFNPEFNPFQTVKTSQKQGELKKKTAANTPTSTELKNEVESYVGEQQMTVNKGAPQTFVKPSDYGTPEQDPNEKQKLDETINLVTKNHPDDAYAGYIKDYLSNTYKNDKQKYDELTTYIKLGANDDIKLNRVITQALNWHNQTLSEDEKILDARGDKKTFEDFVLLQNGISKIQQDLGFDVADYSNKVNSLNSISSELEQDLADYQNTKNPELFTKIQELKGSYETISNDLQSKYPPDLVQKYSSQVAPLVQQIDNIQKDPNKVKGLQDYSQLIDQQQKLGQISTDYVKNYPEVVKQLKDQESANNPQYIDPIYGQMYSQLEQSGKEIWNSVVNSGYNLIKTTSKIAPQSGANTYVMDDLSDFLDAKLKFTTSNIPLVNEDGSINVSRLLPVLSKSVADIGLLIAGSGGVSALVKGAGMVSGADTIGLFVSSYIQSYPEYEKLALESGMNEHDASVYAMTLATSTSALWSFVPNQMKGLVTDIGTKTSEEFLKKIGKEGFKNLAPKTTMQYANDTFKKMVGSIGQNTGLMFAQKIADNTANYFANRLVPDGKIKLQEEMTKRDIYETAIMGFATSVLMSGFEHYTQKDALRNSALYQAATNFDAFKEYLDNGLKSETLTQDQVDAMQKEVEKTILTLQKMPSELPEEKKQALLPLLTEKMELEARKKSVDKSFAQMYDKNIEVLDKQIEETYNTKIDPPAESITGVSVNPKKLEFSEPQKVVKAKDIQNELQSEFPNVSASIIETKDGNLKLSTLFVKPEERNSGLGSKFLSKLKEIADREGKSIEVTATDELGGNISKLNEFYPKNGFEKVGENKFEYKPKTKEDALQEQSTSGLLQHPQEGTGEPGGERKRVEPSKQGNEIAKKGEQKVNLPEQNKEPLQKNEEKIVLTPEEEKSMSEQDQIEYNIAEQKGDQNKIDEIVKKYKTEPKPKPNEENIGGTKEAGNLENSQSDQREKVKVLRKGNTTAKKFRKIKNPKAIEALRTETNRPYDKVLQYFIGGGQLHPSAIDKLYGNGGKKNTHKEKKTRIGIINSKHGLSIDDIAHQLWEEGGGPDNHFESSEYRDAVEQVINSHKGTRGMIDELLNTHNQSIEEHSYYNIDIEPEFIDEAQDYWDNLSDAEKEHWVNESAPPEDFEQSHNDFENKTTIEETKQESNSDSDQKISHAQSSLNVPLSEKEFYKKYKVQHIDVTSKTEAEKESVKKSILENGFHEGFNVNALPIFKNKESSFGGFNNKKGDIVYILPKEGYTDPKSGNGPKTKGGYKPNSSEIVRIEYDNQPTYEAYLNQFKNKSKRDIEKEILDADSDYNSKKAKYEKAKAQLEENGQQDQFDIFGNKKSDESLFANDIKEQESIVKGLKKEVDDAKDVLNKLNKEKENIQPENQLSLADKIRKGKIGDGLQIGIPGFKEAWNGAIEAAARVAEVTPDIIKAIKAGIEYLKNSDYYKALSKAGKEHLLKRFEEEHKNLIPPIEPPKQEKRESKEDGHEKTKITHDAVDTLREELGLSKIGKQPTDIEKDFDEASKEFKNEYKDLAKDAIAKQRPLTRKETYVLGLGGVELKNQHSEITQKIADALEKGDDEAVKNLKIEQMLVEDNMDIVHQALKNVASEAGKSLQAIQVAIGTDYSLANTLLVARSYAKDGKLTEIQRKTFEDITKRLEDAENKLKQYEENKSNIEAQKVIDSLSIEEKVQKGVQQEIEKIHSKLSSSLKAKAERTISALEKIQNKIRANNYSSVAIGAIDFGITTIKLALKAGVKLADAIQMGIDKISELHGKAWAEDRFKADMFDAFEKQGIKTEIETTGVSSIKISKEGKIKGLRKILKGLVEDGVTKIEDILAHIQSQLKKDGIEMTDREIRDEISGYGKTSELSQEPVNVKLREIKRIGGLVFALEDAVEGKPPLRKGLQRDKPTAEELELQKKVNDALRENQLKAEEQPRTADQWKTLLDRYKTRLKNKSEELKTKLEKQDFETKKRKALELDAEALELKKQVQKQKDLIEKEKDKICLGNRSRVEKVADGIIKYLRFSVLTGLIKPTMKLGFAAAFRSLISNPIETLITMGWSKIPGLRKIANQAPRYSGEQIGPLIKGISEWWSKQTAKDIYSLAKGGKGELDVLYGHDNKAPIGFLDIWGQFHKILKTPAHRTEFKTSFEMNLNYEHKLGNDISNPVVQMRAATRALEDANRAIFMQKNKVVSAYKAALHILAGKVDDASIGGKILSKLIQSDMLIVKVPMNFIAEESSLAIGGIKAAGSLLKLRKELNKLTPEQANYISRAITKQLFGMAALGIGYAFAQNLGGNYVKEKKEVDNKKPGDITIGDWHVPHALQHVPFIAVMQLGATFERLQDFYNREDAKHGIDKQYHISDALWATTGTMIKEAPFVRTASDWVSAIESSEGGKKRIAEMASRLLIPVKDLAEYMDKDLNGEVIKRKPETWLELFKINIPGLREQVAPAIKDAVDSYDKPVQHKTEEEKQELKEKQQEKIDEINKIIDSYSTEEQQRWGLHHISVKKVGNQSKKW